MTEPELAETGGADRFGPAIPTPVLYGLAIASVGGPLSLAAVLIPQTVSGFAGSSTLVVIAASLVFIFPLIVWIRFAKEIASSGGLYSYVAAAVGKWPARVQGTAWIVSYFLYLPSTVAFVLYEILPVAFPGVDPWRPWLLVGIPLVIVLALRFSRAGLFGTTAVVGIIQVGLVIALAAVEINHAGAPSSSLRLHSPALATAKTIGSVSLLFLCVSLPLYLGDEVRQARRTLPRALGIGTAVGAGCAVLGVVALAAISPALLSASVPGWSIASAFGASGLATAIVLGTAASMLSLVVLEYVGLTRLVPAMTPLTPRTAEAGVGAAFILAGVLSLLGPDAAYEDLLRPSLVALYLSQVVVFAVYPIWRVRRGRFDALDAVAALVAVALMGYGLYTVVK